ncbi:putative Flagellar biosynthesis protein, FliO [Bradyrhizobium sp. ORS 285]|uniref:flagellar biosynthetic protein FliO n=1 Tax=Bradyrhizobium sp. ORS 285 TaxID=115808 RepID=UPI000B419A4F|nr:flagellar biosynthetic protein FliO [Bradyrhizobium sp. ORS 285]SMX57344.1 putative Flagellar biosynthesis protein, FliO [Bradyrhizobium sp. ORS 285]
MQALTFFFAFVAVLALIGLAAWLVRRFAGNRLGTNPNRGRMPRLAVIDAAAVDGRRRLVLVRRDNIEHLLMIGGPSDIVVESNIVRAMPAREQLPQRPGINAEPPAARIAPAPEVPAWSDNEPKPEPVELSEPAVPELPARPQRPSFIDEVRRTAPAAAERREPPPAFPPEPPIPPRRPGPRPEVRAEPRAGDEARMEPRPERGAPRGEPMMPRPLRAAEPQRQAEAPRPEGPRLPPVRAAERAERIEQPERVAAPGPPAPPTPPAPPPPAPVDQSAEANLAEMAQRLEAALRRPTAEAPPAGGPPTLRPARNEPMPAAAAPAKTSFENLEDEMASLLGRPKSSQ